MYRNLDAEKIIATCRAAREQIGAHLPGSGLSQIAGEIEAVSSQAAELSRWLAQPHLPLRVSAGLGILAVLIIVIGVATGVKLQFTFTSVAEFLQGSEAAINEVVFLGIAVFFFMSLETRLKRRRALKAIHVLRSMAHIIDLHQLTKDPERIGGGPAAGEAGVRLSQSPAELVRYLDHCSDLLSLLSKIAALYVQNFDDPVTISAVNEVEDLTNGLARKIWQKIMIFDRVLALPAPPSPA